MKPSWHSVSRELVDILDHHQINGFETPGGTDKNTSHNYTGIYEHLLAPYRRAGKKSGTLLELGVQFGGSSLLWHDYLPDFYLHLVDIADAVPTKIWDQMEKERYSFYVRNGYCMDTVELLTEKAPEKFDVIIEDGPHNLQSQLFAVEHYFPLLKPGGILIIEDIQDSAHLRILANAVSSDALTIQTFDVRHTKGRYDDLIWTVTKD